MFLDAFILDTNLWLQLTFLKTKFRTQKTRKMKYILDIPENKMAFAEEFFKSISFIKKIKAIASNEITNTSILKGIEEYESKKVTPTPLNLVELKAMINA